MKEWYVLHITCGKEKIIQLICRKLNPSCEIINPKKKIPWRKKGRVITLIRPLFEGYLFVSTTNENIKEFHYLLQKHRMNIGWLVYSAGSLLPISSQEKQLIQTLMDNEGIVGISRVKQTNNQIEIINGPLLGFEKMIKNYSRREQRITVEIPLLQEKKQIKLGAILIGSNGKMLNTTKYD
ncbi:antitermination protein NusG|uniref:Transcriptional antiterminator NusG n=1 Tax=Dendrosporobacter quercicolus TaxID=146817 RepID=A0A1G9S6L4_9FIRM|nr:transcription termination/antitermination NusG family protein [Dendrosporobacter quercicolus]NSL49445.1 antitermination protein NusG [Dendrosporobacter quercicolus DSM 1736]SDM31149.1 transcriptional antiterminator NusG [Dendrosporobacter quercicolus]